MKMIWVNSYTDTHFNPPDWKHDKFYFTLYVILQGLTEWFLRASLLEFVTMLVLKVQYAWTNSSYL